MHPNNDEYLTKTYPILYEDRHGDMSTTCMCWGFEVGDGWFKIINEASEQLEFLNNHFPEVTITAVQIKEKFGTLRFYTQISYKEDASDEVRESKIQHMIFEIANTITDAAENASRFHCEECGRASYKQGGAKLREDGWIRTLCDHCEALRENERYYGDKK